MYLYTYLDVCCTYMLNNLSNENALTILNLAVRHKREKLKEAAMEYVVANVADVMERPELKDLTQDLVLEVMKNIVKKRVK